MSASPEKVVVVDDEDRNKKLEALRDKQLAETEAVAKKFINNIIIVKYFFYI